MVYDCFMFFNELDVLDIRLNTLNDVVDRFVLIESPRTHQGEPKPLYFVENRSRYTKFLDKIIYLVFDEPLPDYVKKLSDLERNWFIENSQRNALIRGLEGAKPSDFVIISDVDEIPSPEAISKAQRFQGVTCCWLRLYYYYLNLRNYSIYLWDLGPKICSVEYLRSGKILENFQYSISISKGANDGSTLTMLRHCRPNSVIRDAGWHFSYMGGSDAILKKLKSIAEGILSDGINEQSVALALANGVDAFNGQFELYADDVDESFPRYLKDNVAKFDKMIFKKTPQYEESTRSLKRRALMRGWTSTMIRVLCPCWVKKTFWKFNDWLSG